MSVANKTKAQFKHTHIAYGKAKHELSKHLSSSILRQDKFVKGDNTLILVGTDKLLFTNKILGQRLQFDQSKVQ